MCVCEWYTVICWNIPELDIIHATKYLRIVYTLYCRLQTEDNIYYIKERCSGKDVKWIKGNRGSFLHDSAGTGVTVPTSFNGINMKTFNRELRGQRAEGEFVGRKLLENLNSIKYVFEILKSKVLILWKFASHPNYKHQGGIQWCFMHPQHQRKAFGLAISAGIPPETF